jgi:hypothetical protein
MPWAGLEMKTDHFHSCVYTDSEVIFVINIPYFPMGFSDRSKVGRGLIAYQRNKTNYTDFSLDY